LAMFLSNKPGVPPGINLLQKPSQKLSRPSGNLVNPVIFSGKPGEDKDSTGSVTEGCVINVVIDNTGYPFCNNNFLSSLKQEHKLKEKVTSRGGNNEK